MSTEEPKPEAITVTVMVPIVLEFHKDDMDEDVEEGVEQVQWDEFLTDIKNKNWAKIGEWVSDMYEPRDIGEDAADNVFEALENNKKPPVIANYYMWRIYIPEEGHWPIRGLHKNISEAKKAYLEWAKRKTVPKGSLIDINPGDI